MNQKSSFRSFLRFYRYAKKWRIKIFFATLYSIVNKLFDIAPEILLGIAVDVVVGFNNPNYNNFLDWLGFEGAQQQVVILAVLTFLIWAFESIFQYLYMVGWRNIAQSIQHSIRLEAYNNVQGLDIEWHETQKLGNTSSILNDDVNQLERFLNNGINEIIQIIVSSLAFIVSPLHVLFRHINLLFRFRIYCFATEVYCFVIIFIVSSPNSIVSLRIFFVS